MSREELTAAVTLARAVPELSVLRWETLTGISRRAWRNAIASLAVGFAAAVVTLVVLRSGGSDHADNAVEIEAEPVPATE